MNDEKLYEQIMLKLCQCVLAARLNITKDQIKNFNQFIQQFQSTKEKAYKGTPQLLLSKLVPRQQNESARKIGPFSNFYKAIITFELACHDHHTCIQKWVLSLHPKHPFQQSTDEIYLFTANLFQQLLFLLTNQPLFKQYIKDSKMKQQYKIHYNLFTDPQQIRKEQEEQDILHFPIAEIKERTCEEFKVVIRCFSVKSIYEMNFIKDKIRRNYGNGAKGHGHGKGKKEGKRNFGRFRNSADIYQGNQGDQELFVDLHQEMDRKHSLYQIYDKDLQCTLLSNLQSSFSFSPKGSVKQIKFFPKELGLEEQQYELLKISPDEEFLNENKKLFKDLSEAQKRYTNVLI